MTRFGIRFLDDLGAPRELIRLAVAAEAAGFDSVWFPHDAFRLNSWAMLAAAAQATERVSLGSRNNIYTSDPSEIATYIATLDHLSSGRAILGLGLHTTNMLEWIGLAGEDPIRRTKEMTEIIRRLLRGEKVPYQGEEFQWTERAFMRVPPLRADLPIYIVPFGRQFLELSGEIGDGSVPMMTPPESAPVMVEPILRGLARSGRDPGSFDICGFGWISVSEDGLAARDRLADVIGYFGAYLDSFALETVGLAPADFLPVLERLNAGDKAGARALVTDDMLRLAIVGTPEECVETIGRMVDAGVTHVSLGGPLGPDPVEAIRLIGEKIIPEFAGMSPDSRQDVVS